MGQEKTDASPGKHSKVAAAAAAAAAAGKMRGAKKVSDSPPRIPWLPPLASPSCQEANCPAPVRISKRPGTSASDASKASTRTDKPLPPLPPAKLRAKTTVEVVGGRRESSESSESGWTIWTAARAAKGTARATSAAVQDSGRDMTDEPRTGSDKRSSLNSLKCYRRPIKYGQGKYQDVELVPQPSDEPDDPLNWPAWRKALHFGSLVLMVALAGTMKTSFITLHSWASDNYSVSYTAAGALTGLPLILSALAGFVSLVGSRIWGKRPVYLLSLLFMFLGAAWNSNVPSYWQCLAARAFQGLGWGAFDSLVFASIHDMYYEHERGLPTAIHSVVAVIATWGPPLVEATISHQQMGFGLRFYVVSACCLAAIPLLLFAAPETTFDRAGTWAKMAATGPDLLKQSASMHPQRAPAGALPTQGLSAYMAKLRFRPFSGPADLQTLLQAPRAFISPTVLLLVLVSMLPMASLWSLAAFLPRLHISLPSQLPPSTVGTLLIGPWLLATVTVALVTILSTWCHFTLRLHLLAIAGGSALVLGGILSLEMHLVAGSTPLPPAHGPHDTFDRGLGDHISLPVVSCLLGILAAGAYVLDGTVRPVIRASTLFTSSSLSVALRNTVDMNAGVTCWRALLAGIAVLVMPGLVSSWEALRAMCIGLAAAQAVLTAAAAAVWWFFGEGVHRCDGRVMRLVDLTMSREGSFFDAD